MSKSTPKIRRREVQLTFPVAELPSSKYRAGSLRRREAIQEAILESLKRCALGREFIAEELSRLTGDKITLNHINNWVAESKNGWRFPLEYAAALVLVTGDDAVIRAALQGCGRHVLDSEEYAMFELGRITVEDMQRRKKRRDIVRRLDI